MNKRIIVALDHTEFNKALALVDEVSSLVDFFKVGLTLFTAEGPRAVKALKERGVRVFLDLKLMDIPTQVAGACARAVDLGVDMLSIHASGGRAMIQAAVEAVAEEAAKRETDAEPPKVVAVTALTSLSPGETQNIYCRSVEDVVASLAEVAVSAGADGVVCSPRELSLLRPRYPHKLLVTPGVRDLPGRDDQHRTSTAAEAIKAGADYLVVGRPITHSRVPADAARTLIESISELG